MLEAMNPVFPRLELGFNTILKLIEPCLKYYTGPRDITTINISQYMLNVIDCCLSAGHYYLQDLIVHNVLHLKK